MKNQLTCKNCQDILSYPITILNGNSPEVSEPELEDYKDVTPKGIAYEANRPYRKSTKDKKDPLDFTPQIWMNINDLTDKTELTDDDNRTGGCCGLDGCDGPNVICGNCNQYIGTQMTDCHTSYLFIPQPETTEWKKV